MAAMAERDNKGLWKKGGSGNPTGKNGHTKGLQRYGARASHWLQKLTLGELQELCADNKKMAKLSSWDAIVLRHINSTLSGGSVAAERETLLCRIEGKPKSSDEFDTESQPISRIEVSWKK